MKITFSKVLLVLFDTLTEQDKHTFHCFCFDLRTEILMTRGLQKCLAFTCLFVSLVVFRSFQSDAGEF